MDSSVLIAVLLVLAFIAANLPWLNNKVLMIYSLPEGKSVSLRISEWFFYYLFIGAISIGMEQKVTGGTHAQEWEFYAVTVSLFLVFAFPGFFFYFYRVRRPHTTSK